MGNPFLTQHGENLAGLMEPQVGNIFYVGGTGAADTNTGADPAHPLKTITHAIVHCTTNMNDVIVVVAVSAADETFPITVNKSKVHIIGSSFNTGIGRGLTPVGDTACFLVTGDKVEIAGMELAAGAAHACIETNPAAQSWGLHVHHCDFGWMSAGRDGILLPAGFDSVQCLIHDNRFNDKLTRDGIRIEQNSTRGAIWNNQFRGVGGIGINLQALCTDIFAIHDNVFRVADSVDGEGITCNANSLGAMIWGNVGMQGVAAMTKVPYRDLGANHWGINYYDIRAIMPVTV